MVAEHDFRNWPRRSAAAERVGLSIQALLRYEGKLVNPIRDAEGHRRYDPQELRDVAAVMARKGHRVKGKARSREAIPRPPSALEPRISGAITKRAFEMFERGESRARVAIELGEPVENVNWLHENWLTMSGTRGSIARGGAISASPTRPRQRAAPEMRIVTEAQVRARSPDQRSEADREMLRWIDQMDEKRRQETAP